MFHEKMNLMTVSLPILSVTFNAEQAPFLVSKLQVSVSPGLVGVILLFTQTWVVLSSGSVQTTHCTTSLTAIILPPHDITSAFAGISLPPHDLTSDFAVINLPPPSDLDCCPPIQPADL